MISIPGKIKIILVEVNKNNNTCILAIEDNGVGINTEAKLKIFEIESTVSTLGTNAEKGTGLGLKLCKEFLTINKGNIWIESEENKGTSVFISLPIKN